MVLWPRHMTAKTLARYLDMGSAPTLHRRLKNMSGFPQKHPGTGRWDREAVDQYLGQNTAMTEAQRKLREWLDSK